MKRGHREEESDDRTAKQWAFEEEQKGVDESGDWECDYEGCGDCFACMEEYEQHYEAQHVNVCLECDAVFSSNFLLEVHLEERHDELFQVLAVKQKSFLCLDPDCGILFWSVAERSAHMITEHVHFDSVIAELFSELQVSSPMSVAADSEQASNKVPSTVCFGRSDD